MWWSLYFISFQLCSTCCSSYSTVILVNISLYLLFNIIIIVVCIIIVIYWYCRACNSFSIFIYFIDWSWYLHCTIHTTWIMGFSCYLWSWYWLNLYFLFYFMITIVVIIIVIIYSFASIIIYWFTWTIYFIYIYINIMLIIILNIIIISISWTYNLLCFLCLYSPICSIPTSLWSMQYLLH